MLTEERLKEIYEIAKWGEELFDPEVVLQVMDTLQQQNEKETERAAFWQSEQLTALKANKQLMEELARAEEQNKRTQEALKVAMSENQNPEIFRKVNAISQNDVAAQK